MPRCFKEDFKAAERAVRDALHDAQRNQELSPRIRPDELAVTLVALVQGGYVLARATRDADKLNEAITGALPLLEVARL